MRHSTYGLAILCAFGAIACSKQEVVEEPPTSSPKETVAPKATEPEPEEAAVKDATFDASRSYKGRISAPRKSSLVIRDAAAYDALISNIPKSKIQKKNPADPSDDPILKRPAVDFSKEMIVVATCSTFYCPISLKSYSVDGDEVAVLVDSPGEGQDSMMMGARPTGMNGEDAYGNYAASVIPKYDGEVTFEVMPKP